MTPAIPTVVHIWLTNEAKVGEWIPLKASQTVSGEVESNIQARLFWFTDATNIARFNVATLADPLGREVVFSQPGTYKIWGVAEPGSVTSNVETVTIKLKP